MRSKPTHIAAQKQGAMFCIVPILQDGEMRGFYEIDSYDASILLDRKLHAQCLVKPNMYHVQEQL